MICSRISTLARYRWLSRKQARVKFLLPRTPRIPSSAVRTGLAFRLHKWLRVLRMIFNSCHSTRMRLICFGAGVTALLSVAACRRGVPVFDPSPGIAQADGTISGTVRGPEGTSAIDGRDVTVVNVDTGARDSVKTNNAGGFTFKVKPGKYRVELALLPGEVLVKQPGVILPPIVPALFVNTAFVLGQVIFCAHHPAVFRRIDFNVEAVPLHKAGLGAKVLLGKRVMPVPSH